MIITDGREMTSRGFSALCPAGWARKLSRCDVGACRSGTTDWDLKRYLEPFRVFSRSALADDDVVFNVCIYVIC